MTDELPIYRKWEDIPDGIATKTTLSRDHGLKLSPDQKPVAQKIKFTHTGREVGYYDLYALTDCIPKKKPTQAQLDALEKARHMAEEVTVHCVRCGRFAETNYGYWTVTRKRYQEDNLKDYVCHICEDHDEARDWAKNLFDYGDFLILDTETTDLHGEIIEIAIINGKGETLLNQRIKPVGEVSPGAEHIHGIPLDALKNCPAFPEVYPKLKELLTGKVVIIYNKSYDVGVLESDCQRHELKPIKFDAGCAMVWYAQWYGDWSNYHGDYKWQRLGGGHDALGDCQETLKCLKAMAFQE